MSREITLLEGEEVRLRLKPHFLSFFHMYILCFVLIILGLIMYFLFQSSGWESYVSDNLSGVKLGDTVPAEATVGAIVWTLFMIIIGWLGKHFWMDKGGRKLFFLNILIVILGIGGLIAWSYIKDPDDVDNVYHMWLPFVGAILGFIGFVGINYYRSGFHYTLTNLRLVISRHFITIEQRVVRYSKIEDVAVQQGFIGRMFGYGTVIPITGSGLGTGSDETMAMAAASTEVAGVHLGAGGGSRKSMRISKASPEDCLFGVKNPIKVREAISQFMHDQSQVTQVSKQHDTLEDMKKLMEQQAAMMQQQMDGDQGEQ